MATETKPVTRRTRGTDSSPAPSLSSKRSVVLIKNSNPLQAWEVAPIERPRYTREVVKRIWTEEKLMSCVPDMMDRFAEGASLHEVAAYSGVPYCIIYDRCRNAPDSEFAQAVKMGTDLAAAWWKEQGRRNLGNASFNTGMYVFQMANRFGWSRADSGAGSVQDGNLTVTRTTSTSVSCDLSKLSAEELSDMRNLVGKAQRDPEPLRLREENVA